MASAIKTVANAASSGLERAQNVDEPLTNYRDRAIMAEVRMIGGALVAIVIVALVLTEVYQAINISESSPFYGIVQSAESTGVAAITLLVVGLLVLAASVIMRFMGGSFGR